MHILITGGTGLVGGHLVPALLQAGHNLTLLSRRPRASDKPHTAYRSWNGKQIPADLPHVDAVINLAGAGIADHRWTPEFKQEILSSRVHATEACVRFIQQQAQKPVVFLSASAVGYYGSDHGLPRAKVYTEQDPPGKDFLGSVGSAWEQAASGAGIRTVIPRLGVVLAREGGAFPKLLAPFKLYAGGHIGTGKQGFPWVHIDDVVGALLFLLGNAEVKGPVNLVAPEIHTNHSFAQTLGKVLHKPAGLPVPGFVLRLMLGESASLVTEGQKVSSEKLQALGYTYLYAEAEKAISSLVSDEG